MFNVHCSLSNEFPLYDPLEVDAERSLQVVGVSVVLQPPVQDGVSRHHLLRVVQAVVRVLAREHRLTQRLHLQTTHNKLGAELGNDKN